LDPTRWTVITPETLALRNWRVREPSHDKRFVVSVSTGTVVTMTLLVDEAAYVPFCRLATAENREVGGS